MERNENKDFRPENDILITRILNAPPELVFKEWTEPERLKLWWGPKGFTMPHCNIDLRPGGTFHYCMRSPEGRDFWGKSTFREISEPQLLVLTDSFADEKGNIVPATYYGMSQDWPRETLITLAFTAEKEGKTRLILRHILTAVPATERDMCKQGWNESLDKLEKALAKDCVALGTCRIA